MSKTQNGNLSTNGQAPTRNGKPKPTAKELNREHARVLCFIARMMISNNRPPVLREIVQQFHLPSINAAVWHVMVLTKHGFLRREEEKHHKMQLTPSGWAKARELGVRRPEEVQLEAATGLLRDCLPNLSPKKAIHNRVKKFLSAMAS
jgi:hypothetical protein